MSIDHVTTIDLARTALILARRHWIDTTSAVASLRTPEDAAADLAALGRRVHEINAVLSLIDELIVERTTPPHGSTP